MLLFLSNEAVFVVEVVLALMVHPATVDTHLNPVPLARLHVVPLKRPQGSQLVLQLSADH